MKRPLPKTREQHRRHRRRRSAALAEAWPPGTKKPWGTPRHRYEVKLGSRWFATRDRGHKPVVGGMYVHVWAGPYSVFARILDVREVRR